MNYKSFRQGSYTPPLGSRNQQHGSTYLDFIQKKKAAQVEGEKISPPTVERKPLFITTDEKDDANPRYYLANF